MKVGLRHLPAFGSLRCDTSGSVEYLRKCSITVNLYPQIVIWHMVTREGKGSLHGSLDLHEASVAGFSIVMLFEPLENFNVLCAFDVGFAQIAYQPSVQREPLLWIRGLELGHDAQQVLYGVLNSDRHRISRLPTLLTDEAERLVETTDLVLPLGFHSEQELACGFQVDHAALGVLGNDMDVLE